MSALALLPLFDQAVREASEWNGQDHEEDGCDRIADIEEVVAGVEPGLGQRFRYAGTPHVVVEKPFRETARAGDGHSVDVTVENARHLADTMCHSDVVLNVASTIAIEAAENLKSKYPHSAVTVENLQTGEKSAVEYKPDLGRVLINRPGVSAFGQTGHRADIAE